jgi:hypothetical protein
LLLLLLLLLLMRMPMLMLMLLRDFSSVPQVMPNKLRVNVEGIP